MKKIEGIEAALKKLTPKERAQEIKKHADTHNAQELHHGPLIPFHFAIFDPMHGYHSEVNAFFEEAIHQFLIEDTPDEEAQTISKTCRAS